MTEDGAGGWVCIAGSECKGGTTAPTKGEGKHRESLASRYQAQAKARAEQQRAEAERQAAEDLANAEWGVAGEGDWEEEQWDQV